MELTLTEAISCLKSAMRRGGVIPSKGLGDELFQFASSLMPVVNVDLLVMNDDGQVLLSWRDDIHSGRGWHVVGGCLRLGESIEERLQKTALLELGTSVEVKVGPPIVKEVLLRANREHLQDQLERSHFISMIYKCTVPSGYQIDNRSRYPGQAGYLRWFNTWPSDLLEIQAFYRDLHIF